MSLDPEERSPASEHKLFATAIAGTAFLALTAIGLSFLFGTPLAPQLAFSIDNISIGIIATLPLVIFLHWFSITNNPTFKAFRQSQIEFFANIGFEFTPFRILSMAIAAGISEELLFRGVLQSWLASHSTTIIAIIIVNVLFGLLHMRTVLYAVIAGLVGAYLGALYAVADNLIAPMVTHGLYDYIALYYTRRAVAEWRNNNN